MDDTDNGASSSESVEAITVMSPNDRASAIGTGTPPSNSRWSPRSGSISAFAFRSRQEALPSPEAYQSSSYDSAPSSAEVYLDANVNASVGLEPQTLLILVGLPGSGKSTFTHALTALPVDARHRPWIRASQDDSFSGKRGEVEYTVRRALQRGCNVVVDRVNFDAA
jgi:ABC-type glutathione transport system ATPase component